MSELNEIVLDAMLGELKVAFKYGPVASKMLGAIGAGAGTGMTAGAVIGGAVGGYKKYQQNRAEGGSVAESLGGSLANATGGALRGAAVGSVAGGLGGAALAKKSPELAGKFRSAVNNLPGAQFGQRQVHTFTGWKPEEGLASIGHGAGPRLKGVQDAEHALAAAKAGKTSPRLGDRLMGRSATEGAESRLHQARSAHQAGQAAEDMGLTSIPGYAKSLRDNGVKKTIGTAVNDQWKGMSPGMKALTVGMPGLEVAHAVASPNKPDEQGRSKAERIGSSVASMAGGMLLSPLTLTGQVVAGSGLSRAGGAMGRLVGKKKSSLHPPTPQHDLTAESGHSMPVERQISDRASGTETFHA